MRAWSLSLGRWFGVELRLHLVFLVALGVCARAAILENGSAVRGIGLACCLLSAVAVREIARALAMAWLGLDLKRLLLLPTGALPTFAGDRDRLARPGLQWRLALAGPAANLLAGAVLAALLLSTSPELDLVHRPWLDTHFLLRSLVWSQLLLALVNLLPAAPLDLGRVLRAYNGLRYGADRGARAALGLTQGISLLVSLAGVTIGSIPLMLLGVAILLAALIERPEIALDLAGSGAAEVSMRDVMLIDFAMLAASDTLEQALEHAIHVSQDVFPVVRGLEIVGAVSRQGILQALNTEGDGYVQGLMTRTLSIAAPDDSLVKVLGRIAGGSGAQMLPVVEGERVLGIVTAQHLAGSMRLLHQRQRWQRSLGRGTR